MAKTKKPIKEDIPAPPGSLGIAHEQTNLPAVTPKKELVLEGDPQAQLDFAMKAADALMRAVKQKKNPVMIRGEQYLEYGDWQTLARFFGATASVAWTKPLIGNGRSSVEIQGYEARAEVLHNGVVISAAEAMCTRDEKNWKDRDEFMLRSMAQTRASAKALRNAYGWVAELAGMKATPAEEMGDTYDRSPIHADAVPVVTGADEAPKPLKKPVFVIKKEIQAIADSQATTILKTGRDYGDWVFEQVTLNLADQSEENLLAILKALQVKFDLAEPE